MINEILDYAKKRINEFVWEQKTSEKLRGMDIKFSHVNGQNVNAVILSFRYPMNLKKGTIATPIATSLSPADFKMIFDDMYKFYVSHATSVNSSTQSSVAQISNSRPHTLKQKTKDDSMYQSMKIFAPIEKDKLAI